MINTNDLFFAYKNSSDTNKKNYHHHYTHEIYFLISGQCRYFVNDKTYLLSKNTIIFIPKDTIHKNVYNSGNCERIVINIGSEYINENILPHIEKIFEQQVYVPDDFELIKKLLNNIGKEYRKNDELSHELIKCYLTELFSYFIRNASRTVIDTASNPAIERLIKYINSDFSQSVTLESAAHMLNLTPPYLSRLFLKNTGFNFKEYLLLIRIKNAKNMLKNTDNSIRQIAYDCGFNDSNYFSKIFKESTGLSPLQYKKGRSVAQ